MMKQVKRTIEKWARLFGMERAIFYYVFWKDSRRHREANASFRREHPDVPLPPDLLRFDVIATTSAAHYHRSGQETAELIAREIRQRLDLTLPLRVGEWGCGPGRVLYALSQLFGDADIQWVGTDAYARSVQWAREALGDRISFHQNVLKPPLPFEGDHFDMMYAISVFTHLSENLSRQWMAEILRVLKPGACFLFSSHSGSEHHQKLTPPQREQLQQGRSVSIHSWYQGSQMFEGLHPEPAMRQWVAEAGGEVLDYRPGGLQRYQDLWLVRKAAP